MQSFEMVKTRKFSPNVIIMAPSPL